MTDLNLSEIKRRFSFSAAVESIKAAYVASAAGQVLTPPVGYLAFPDSNGDCHIKYGHIHGSPAFVIKIGTGFYDNPDKGLPSSNGMMLVFSAQSGEPLATLRDEGWLTDIRTGIGGALATQALAKPGFTEVLIVGTGLQCWFQADCLQKLVEDRALNFKVWGRSCDKARHSVEMLRKEGCNAKVADDLEFACGEAEVVITTTPTRSALISQSWIKPGTHITAIGADTPGKQELETGLIISADLRVCDLKSQSLDHGEFQHASASGELTENSVVELGEILAGRHEGRQGADQITIADLTGIAAQDIAVSLSVLEI